MRLTWPLTGRAREMRLIEAALAEPDTSGIVINGAAGMGKSRIATEALDLAAARGSAVRWVVGSSSARGLPLGALASWAGPAGDQGVQLVYNVIESLTAASEGVPVIVGVDDVHLLDELSMFVLHQVIQRKAAKLVLTLRDGEAVPDGIQELWKVGHFEWLGLGPLPPDSTVALLSVSLDGSIDADTARRLYQLTRGNALYLRHIVEQEVADGRLRVRHGQWLWNGEPTVPQSLIELIDSRIGRLRPEVGTVIDVLAVGEPIDLSALQRITDAAAVEEADTLGLISLDQLGHVAEVRVAHPLYGEVRRNRAAPTRLRRLRGLVAAELAVGDNRDDVAILVRRAELSLNSDLPLDGDLLVRAAQGAVCLADLPLAERLAEAATGVTSGPIAHFIRAHALSWLGEGQSAERVLAELSTAPMTEDDRARFTYLRASNLLWALADPERAKEVIDGASHLETAAARCAIDAIRAVYLFATDQSEACRSVAEDLVLDDLPAVMGAETAWVLTNIHGDAGRTAAATAVAEVGYRIVLSSDAPQMRFNISDAQVSALALSGQIASALELANRERGHAADLPGSAYLLGIAIAGRAALDAGQLDVAIGLLDQASAGLFASGHAIGWGYRYRIPFATALAMGGSFSAAADVLASLDRLQRPYRALNYEIGLARAWTAAAEGLVSEGIDILRRTADTAATRGQFAAEVVCLQVATQFGDRGCEHRLRALEQSVEGPRVGLAARFAAALHGAVPAALEAVSDAFEDMGDRVAALDAAAHAAVAYRHGGLRGSAMRCVSRAEGLAAQCGNVRTPARAAAASEPLPLTDREREVVALLGQGKSNRDMADLLVVSVRTVEGHIYKAMIKTGTNSREELAALLRPRNPRNPSGADS